MELVYLWVEDYKNIKRQGFNFSPKYHCDYNSDTNELTIDDRDDYIPDFFGDNINVTAIVGKNGSGKSSIQKLIFMLIYYHKFKAERIESKYKKNNSFIIIYDDGYKYIRFNENLTLNNDKIKEYQDINFFTIHFNYMIDTWFDNEDDAWIKTIYHRSDGYDTPLLLEPYKGHKEQVIDIDNLEYLNILKLLRYLKSLQEDDKTKDFITFFTPTNIKYSKNNKIQEIGGSDIVLNDAIIQNIDSIKDYQILNRVYIILKTLKIGNNDELFKDKLFKDFEKSIADSENFKKTIEIEGNFKEGLLLKGFSDYYKTVKIEQCLKFEKQYSNIKETFEKYINKSYVSMTELSTFIDILPPWLDIDLSNKEDKTYRSLSSGEKQILSLAINILYQIDNIKSEKSNKKKTINIFLDETELGLHPDWQKKYIDILLKSIKQFENIHLIFATHSPFLLSDIPKQNIIFLDTDDEGKCKVVDGLKEKKETFGANIHTLLSDSFFMEDGLMGEFAKGKIEEVIDYLNDKESPIKNNDEAQKLINIIGEPIIKNQLQKMLDSKRLIKIDKIDLIEKQIKILQDELKKVQK